MKKSVVFVMGSPHSGTTLLTLILGAHSRAASLGEMEGLAGIVADRDVSDSYCLICEGPCPLWEKRFAERFARRHYARGRRTRLRGLNPFRRGFHEELFARTGAELLVDSSKASSWRTKRLAERRDWRRADPRLVFIFRDGRAAVNSWKRKYPETSVAELARKWKANIEQFETELRSLEVERRAFLSYEALASNPEATIRALCAELDLAFEPAMVDYWAHEHHVFRANAGTVSLIRRHRERMAAGARRTDLLQPERETYYAALEGRIELDERWRHEMSAEDLAVFESVAGETNRAYLARAGAHGEGVPPGQAASAP